MSAVRRSLLVFLGLMVFLVLVKAVLEFAAVEAVVASQEAIFGWPVIGFLALIGACAVWLGPRAGLPYLWDPEIPSRKWLLLPAIAGIGLGGVNLAVHAVTGSAQTIAEAANVPSINVPFPESILFYTGGAIIVETLYRLILLTLPFWLIGQVILRRRGRTTVFWILAAITSLVEPWGQMSLVSGHLNVMLALGVAMYAINILEANLFWRYGFLAPLTFRVAFYLIWHGVGSAIGV
jgi:hypothetical protein